MRRNMKRSNESEISIGKFCFLFVIDTLLQYFLIPFFNFSVHSSEFAIKKSEDEKYDDGRTASFKPISIRTFSNFLVVARNLTHAKTWVMLALISTLELGKV